MQRQDSGGSQASSASGMSGMSGMSAATSAADRLGADQKDNMEQNKLVQTAVFGVLAALFKERWEDSKRYLLARLLLEHLQLLLILLAPQFLWTLKYEHWLWQVLNYPLLKELLVGKGYTAYNAVLYIMVVYAGLTWTACVYISINFARTGKLPRRWMVRLLRMFTVVFYQVLYVTVLHLLLGPSHCHWLARAGQPIKYRNADFPAVVADCRRMPHLANLMIGAAFAVLHTAMGGLFALADVAFNPVTQHWLTAAQSTVEVKAWCLKTLVVLAANLLSGMWKLQAATLLIAAWWLAYIYIRWEPYYFQWMNHLRAGVYALTAFIATMLLVNMWWEDDSGGQGHAAAAAAAAAAHITGATVQESALRSIVPESGSTTSAAAATTAAADSITTASTAVTATTMVFNTVERFQQAHYITNVMLRLLPLALVFGVVVSWVRLHLATKVILRKFRSLNGAITSSSLALKDVHKFVDEYEVEMAARCCRQWDDWEDKVLNPEAVQLAETILKAGLERFSRSAHMAIVYANFLAFVKHNQQSSHGQLQAARKLEPNMCDRYIIFVRELDTNASQQQAVASAEAGVDLIGYVEFQRNYRCVLNSHKAALYALRNFWKVLLQSSVRFNDIVTAFRKIESCRVRADNAYKTMLERYPTNVKALRAYARFHEDVLSNPWGASRYNTEADLHDEQERTDNVAMGRAAQPEAEPDGEGANQVSLTQVDEKNSAVCVINAQGIIQLANKVLLKLFGYRKDEVEGKNVSIIMPQPFSGRHNSYLHNYQTTGKAQILDTSRSVVAQHKERWVFPVTIAVTKVSGAGADAVYMGVLKPAAQDSESVKVWISPGGTVWCVDSRFADWFGTSPADCVNKPFSTLGVEPDKLEGLLEAARHASPEEYTAGAVSVKNVLLTHKYAGPQPADITIELGGTDNERVYQAVIRKCESHERQHQMVTDHAGRILYITAKLAELLGSTPKMLLGVDFSRFMAQPFMQLHSKWMKEAPVRAPISSCRSGAPTVLITQNSTPVPAKLDISIKDQGDKSIYVIKVMPKTFPQALDDRRLSLRINPYGQVLAASDAPATLFGFRPSALVERNINECLDVFFGLPATGGAQRLDMEHLITELVHRVVDQKDISWRCGVHPPMTTEEVTAAQHNVVQANMLANRTKAALMQLEVQEAEDELGGVVGLTLHLWRAEMLTGVVEVNKDAEIVQAGCCTLHQPGPLFGVPSSAMQRTPLSKWLPSIPAGYDGLLLDTKEKTALKHRTADIKIGPTRHASGMHSDGDPVHVVVQAVVKEGMGAERRLCVKLSIEKPRKGNPNFARRLLGLIEAQPSAPLHPATMRLGEAAAGDTEGNEVLAIHKQHKLCGHTDFGSAEKELGAAGEDDDVDEGSSIGAAHSQEHEQSAVEGSDRDETPKVPKGHKSDRVLEWMCKSSILSGDHLAEHGDIGEHHGHLPFEHEGLPPSPTDEDAAAADNAGAAYGPPPDMAVADEAMSMSGVDDALSVQEPEHGYRSDFQQGKRLRKLAKLLSSKSAQKASTRFHKHTLAIIVFLLVAHIGCFITSIAVISGEKTLIDEAVDAGTAIISMHRVAIDCRVLDAICRNITHPNIFTAADLQQFVGLLSNAAAQFTDSHEKVYLGGDSLRRFKNRARYKLADYWETPMWEVSEMIYGNPRTFVTRKMGLWEMGNTMVASAREVYTNWARMTANGDHLDDNRFWYFVMRNGPGSLYNGYKLTLYGLVERSEERTAQVKTVMITLLIVEGVAVFLGAAFYVWLLTHHVVMQRANLFSVFMVVPTGFLRALASKQVQLDDEEDADDDGSEAGDEATQQEQQQLSVLSKPLLLLAGKKEKGAGGDGIKTSQSGRGADGQLSMFGRLAHSCNPLKWFGSRKGNLDTGKKQLVRNSRDSYLLTLPFIIWGLAISIIYITSTVQLTTVNEPFHMLNMIKFLVFRVSRVVYYALETAMASPDPAMIAVLKNQTAVRLHDLETDYISFLYGFKALGPGAKRNDLSADEPAIYKNDQLTNIFFRQTGCLRKDKSTCFPPGHKFYDVVHSGLDGMATRFFEEMHLLLADANEDIHLGSSRLEYIWKIGRKDLFEGMQLADETFRGGVEAVFATLKEAHAIMFIMSLLAALLLWLLVLRPYIRHTRKETMQIAEMLSKLPPDLDIEGLISQALTVDVGDEGNCSAKTAGHKSIQEGMASQKGSMSGVAGVHRGGFGAECGNTATGKGSAMIYGHIQ